MGRKQCGKKRNCLYRAISCFPRCLQRLILQTCKNQGLFGKRLKKKNDIILDYSKWKADDTCKRNLKLKFCSGVENIVAKGEKNGQQHFLLFIQCFQGHND